MPFTINNISKNPIAKLSRNIGLEYPEIFVMFVMAVVLVVTLDFVLGSLILLAIIFSGSFILIALGYRGLYSRATDVGVVALMAMLVGYTQFYEPISMALLLLTGIRLILSHNSTRITMIITIILTATIFGLLQLVLPTPPIEFDTIYVVLLSVLAIITAWWQFWEVYNQGEAWHQEAQKGKQRLTTMVSVINKLSRFIPPQVWKPIVKNDLAVTAFNKRAKLTVFVSDIAGFTELSDTLSADNLAEILNTYMDSMTIITDRHGAVLDKFIGDGMVCFFGEPTSNGVRNDALACVAMAVDMRREMRKLRHQWRLQGFEGLYVRIGIHTGYCHVGNFGSNNRLNYTLIGRTVNLAARLESAAEKGTILISQDTYDYVNHDYDCTSKGALDLKGFDKPVLSYQVLDPDERQGAKSSKWIDQNLPGFNLQLNFKDIKNYDYRSIKAHLNLALERVEKAQDNIDD